MTWRPGSYASLSGKNIHSVSHLSHSSMCTKVRYCNEEDTVIAISHPRTQEVEMRGWLWVQVQCMLHSASQFNLGHRVKLSQHTRAATQIRCLDCSDSPILLQHWDIWKATKALAMLFEYQKYLIQWIKECVIVWVETKALEWFSFSRPCR